MDSPVSAAFELPSNGCSWLSLPTKDREELFRAHPDLDDEDIRQAREYAIAYLEHA